MPSSPRDDGVIDALLALLPPSEGAPIYTPGQPPTPQYPLGLPTCHRFPSSLYDEALASDDDVAETPFGLGKLVGVGPRADAAARASYLGASPLSRELASLPTSISGDEPSP